MIYPGQSPFFSFFHDQTGDDALFVAFRAAMVVLLYMSDFEALFPGHPTH